MGPLKGITIIEIAGIGPGPFAAMSLADMGADVIRVERPGGGLFAAQQDTRLDLLNRGKRCIGVDLKTPEGVDTVLRLVEEADALLEGNRPGVMERLGLGPDVCLERNPRLVYGRMTGWGQEGPLASEVGHDLNYVALTGALHAMGRVGEKPAIPLNLVGDFGGGGLMLAYGMVCALLEAKNSGQGQVVDAAMIDGAATLMASTYAANQVGFWSDERGTNVLDSGSHFYEVYETADGKWVSIASIEAKFYAEMLEKTGVRSKCVTLLIDGPEDADPWGREALYDGDTRVGRLTSGGYSVAFGKSIGMGYVTPDLAVPGIKLKVRMFDQLWDAEIVQDSPYDPKNERIRIDG